MKIKEQSEWKVTLSWPHRGITDYEKTIDFEVEPDVDQLKDLIKELQTNNCPGWTPIQFRKDNSKYFFFTSYDSSD